MDYEGWCRRIDLNLRTMHPTLTTSIYKIKTNSFLIEIHQHIENKEEIEENFENKIRFITTPVKLIWETPEYFEKSSPRLMTKQSRQILKDYRSQQINSITISYAHSQN